MKKILSLLSLILFAVSVFFAGCEDRKDLDPISAAAPAKPSLGSTNFDKFVSVGNSITAGYQSSALYESGQKTSFGCLLAAQVQTSYTYPTISEAGIGGKISLLKLDITTYPPTPYLTTASTKAGSPLNFGQAATYNNLGIPGAIAYDLLDQKLNYDNLATEDTAVGGRNNPFYKLVLRDTARGITSLDQAIKFQATFMTLWIGNNDVLGYATTGGTKGTDPATKKLPTDLPTFTAIYNGIIGKIAGYLPNTKVAVANIPDVKAIPFFTTVGPSVYLKLKDAPSTTRFYYMSHNVSGGVASASPMDLATLKVMITLKGSAWAGEIGKPSSKFYTDNKIPVPAGINTSMPFGLDPTNPFPDPLVLDSIEAKIASDAVVGFNNIISTAIAGKANFTLVDVNSFFNELRAADAGAGTMYNGITFKTSFLSGGLFSLDGVHPSSQAHAIIANKFIQKINSTWGAAIPLINVATIPVNLNLAKVLSVDKYGLPVLPKGVLDNLLF